MADNDTSSGRGWKKLATAIGVAGGLTYLAGLVGLYLGQDRLLLHPDDSFYPDDTDHPLYTLNDWSDDGSFLGLVAEPRQTDPLGTVLYFHGNSGHVSHRVYAIKALTALGYRVVLAEYPGFGRRAGTATAGNCLTSALLDFARVRAQWADSKLFVMGESFGTGVASQVVANSPHEVAGVALFTPWNSLTSLVKEKYPFIPVRLMLKTKMDSRLALSEFKGPIFIVGAGADTLIPPEHARLLAAALPGSVYTELAESSHGAWMSYMDEQRWRYVMQTLDPTTSQAAGAR
jgi:hypothetical protein